MAVSGYNYYREITIDNTKVDATLTSYPAMVKLTSGNFDFSKVNTDGYDIVFTDTSDNLIDFEMEYFVKVDEIGVFHVEVASVSSSVDTKIRMHYGKIGASDQSNKTGVWDSDYVLVSHMGTTLEDSTSNGQTMTNNGTTVVDGQNGKARNFVSSSSQYIDISSVWDDFPSNDGDFTLQVLFKVASATAQQELLDIGDGTAKSGFRMLILSSNIWSQLMDGSDRVTSTNTTSIANGSYQSASSSYDGTNHIAGLNSNFHTETSGDWIKDPGTDAYIGREVAGAYLDGIADEVRISKTARTAAWKSADDYGLRLDTLLSVGSEQTPTAGVRKFVQLI